MKKFKLIAAAMALVIAGLATMAADHIDAPAVTSTNFDIADLFVFESPADPSNMVFAVTSQGLLSPNATKDAAFDENVMIEFNIDNDGDNVEDLLIQGVVRDGKMITFGPFAPTTTGLNSTITTSANRVDTDITAYGEAKITNTNGGVKTFAGPRDDPFFFDLGAFQAILGGQATGFNDPGTDTFAGTNVLAYVVELPKTMLGTSDMINVWVETKRKN